MKSRRTLASHSVSTTDDTLVEHVTSALRIEPLQIDRESVRQHPASGRGERVTVTVSVPYSGERRLWFLRPSSWSSVFPSADVSESDISVSAEGLTTREDAPRIRASIDRQLDEIARYLEWQPADLDTYHRNLEKTARHAVQSLKEEILARRDLERAIGIPLQRRGDVPLPISVPLERRRVRRLPATKGGAWQPEYGIPPEEYEYILRVVRHEGRTFERTPGTYAVHDEQELRDILLSHLNGHYEGNATGESFRKSGRTDILIEHKSRAAFVAECGVWDGAEWLLGKCDQLLGYLTWRDCKTALVLFNKRNRSFSGVLGVIPEALARHPCFLRLLRCDEQGEWRCVFRSPEDEACEITVHIFAFDLFVGEGG